MKNKKLFTLIAMLLCSASIFAYDFKVDGICYNITNSTDKTVEVTHNGHSYNYYTEYSGHVIIPEYANYNKSSYRVTRIGEHAFDSCTGLTSIEIPNSVTSIGERAFEGCTGLTSIIIPNSVTSIGKYAFDSCTGLISIEIPNSVTTIGEGAFYGCTGLTSIIIPNSVTSIGEYAFNGCTHIKSLTIGAGVLSIGSNYDCTPTKTIWLTNTPPKGYEELEGIINYVANDQYGLSNVKVYPYLSSLFEVGGVRYVPISPAERTCDAIDCSYDNTVVDINIGETVSFKGVEMKVQNIMPYTLYEQTSIKNVSIDNNGDIGKYSFYGCSGITEATISNEGNIGNSAFEASMKSENMILNVSNKGDIGEMAFYGCSGIIEATISNEGNIGNSAFSGCTSLKTAKIEIGDNTQEVESYTFADWTSTNTADFSKSSETYTFMLQSTTTLIFDWSVSSEPDDYLIVILDGEEVLKKSGNVCGTFIKAVGKGTHSLVVAYSKGTSNYNYSVSDMGKVYNIAVVGANDRLIGNYAFNGCSSLEILTLGNDVISIGDRAFNGCKNLIEVSIPNATRYIGNNCFNGCSSMKTLEIGDGIVGVPQYAFAHCSSLNSIKWGKNVEILAGYSFIGCSTLPTIEIPASVTSIGNYAFSYCTSLADVIIKDRTTDLVLGSNGSYPLFVNCPLDSVYIGGNISYDTSSRYGYSPFYSNTSLRSVVITDQEEEISDNEFYGCTNLKNVSIGSNVKKIGNRAFSSCSNLDYFSFGKSMENIGEEAFSDCVNMTQIISHAQTPPICGAQALDDINKWNCTLKIPEGTDYTYKTADQWKEFFFIEGIPSAINGLIINRNTGEEGAIYNLNGERMRQDKSTLPTGIYIQNGKKFVVK